VWATDEGVGGHSPGARLTLRRRRGTESLALTARKNKRVGPTHIGVEYSEHRDGLEIIRSVSVVHPSKAFDFEILPGRAGVPILGPGSIRASLVRAVLNPSHTF
jgi:hypothetical protein